MFRYCSICRRFNLHPGHNPTPGCPSLHDTSPCWPDHRTGTRPSKCRHNAIPCCQYKPTPEITLVQRSSNCKHNMVKYSYITSNWKNRAMNNKSRWKLKNSAHNFVECMLLLMSVFITLHLYSVHCNDKKRNKQFSNPYVKNSVQFALNFLKFIVLQ